VAERLPQPPGGGGYRKKGPNINGSINKNKNKKRYIYIYIYIYVYIEINKKYIFPASPWNSFSIYDLSFIIRLILLKFVLVLYKNSISRLLD
jgi:hypothetical protein